MSQPATILTTVLSTTGWFLKCVFSCNHLRTPVNEGKCYCPDCGRGLIYQWVVIRCKQCQLRLDARTVLRQVVPAQRCCAACGEQAFRYEYLEAPSYFQLHKARLIVREELDYLQGRLHWSVYGFGETVGRQVEKTLAKTRAWLEPAQPAPQWLALLPVRVTSGC